MKNYLDPTFATNIYLKDIIATSASSTDIGNMKRLSVRPPQTLPQTLPQSPHHLASRHPVQDMNLRILVTHIRPLITHNKGSSETIASVLQKRGMIVGVLNSPVCVPKILRQSLSVLVSLHSLPFLPLRPRQLIQPVRLPRILHQHLRVPKSLHVVHPLSHG
jgi:hypothetical protein